MNSLYPIIVNNKTKLSKFILSSIILIISNQSHSLSLPEYLKQVAKNNQGLHSNQLLMESGFARSKEGFLITQPHLIGSISYVSDSQPPVSEAVRGVKTQTENYNLGIAKKFSTGTEVKFEYDSLYNNISNPRPDLVRHNKFWYAKPVISLQQPLFKDWLGTQTKALIELKNSQMKAQGHANKFALQNILTEAKTVYWDLATLLADIQIKQESVKRAKNLVDWANKRNKLGLGNDSDQIQATSALLQRELALQGVLDNKKNKARLFNALRNIKSDSIDESLSSFKDINIKQLAPKNKKVPPGVREDLKTEYQNYKISQAQATVSEQNIEPSVDFKIQYYPSGRDTHYIHALSESFRGKHNTAKISLQFDVPLDINLNKNLNSAYKAQKRAAELALSRKKFEVANEWQRLAEQFELLEHRLNLAKQLEDNQLNKLKNEETLLRNGRSTTFQVIQFEQDYLAAQSQFYSTKNIILKLSAALELFES